MTEHLEQLWAEYDDARDHGAAVLRSTLRRVARILGFLDGLVVGYQDHRTELRKVNQ